MKLLATYNLIALAVITIAGCGGNTPANPVAKIEKVSSKDPFKNNIVPSQNFTVNPKQDNVIQGAKGTVVVLPKGCFINVNGEVVEGDVTIELAEALTMDDMVTSNLTTTADGKMLETGGMLYISATANGEQLSINKNNPLYIEVPTTKKKPGMMLYQGVRDTLGNMNWKNPKKIDNYLVTVSIDKLDFLPEGFANEVEMGMPFRKYKKATEKLTDSLYYSLSGISDIEWLNWLIGGFETTNEPLLNEVKTKDPDSIKTNNSSHHGEEHGSSHVDSSNYSCGIDPATIKTLKSPQYKNTLITTREFEARLKVLFKTCRTGIVELYINNLDKNMYEIDSLAAIRLKGSGYEQEFINFKNLRQGKVKNGDKRAELLKGFYEKKLLEVKTKLDAAKDKYVESLKKATADFEVVKKEYSELLVKRESYRMETYGFTLTDQGWLNIDVGTDEKSWAPQNLEIIAEGGKGFDRTYTYVIFTSINSLVRLNTADNETFYTGKADDKYMNMPKKQKAIAIVVAYKNEQLYFTVKEFETTTSSRLTIKPVQAKPADLKKALQPYQGYLTENKIDEDLKYMDKFYKEQQRVKKLQKENKFMLKLYDLAYPCCGGEEGHMAK